MAIGVLLVGAVSQLATVAFPHNSVDIERYLLQGGGQYPSPA